eukprot:COSAG01_NODE_789_length_13572_cov_322.875158_11_plen_123_part_00
MHGLLQNHATHSRSGIRWHYVLTKPMPGTVPLKLFWHDGRQDNASVATEAGISSVLKAGYAEVRIEGYVFPEKAEGLVPLKLFWHAGRNDNASTALPQSHASAVASAYGDVRVEMLDPSSYS